MILAIANKTIRSGSANTVQRETRARLRTTKDDRLTGKKSSMAGKFNYLPVTVTGILPRVISRLATALDPSQIMFTTALDP